LFQIDSEEANFVTSSINSNLNIYEKSLIECDWRYQSESLARREEKKKQRIGSI
jgi:hypothetical protein